jgi:formyltetrahydrofolate deformylase
MSSARLLVSCPDRPGIVAAISSFLFERGANILDSAQHSTDPADGTFFLRMEFQLEQFDMLRSELEGAFDREVGRRFSMEWRLSSGRKKFAILVSRHQHCLLDLIWRWRGDELGAEVVGVISNHRDLASDVAVLGVPFTHVPVESARKAEAEAKLLALLQGKVDFLVLARYMQILSPAFLERIGVPIINIHHSFLPAFVGADPYRRAYDRGVKIIGATAHYVTEELDEGPIIEQDVQRVSHRLGVAELKRVGRDIERTVLSRAVLWHSEDRVIVDGRKTFVFD